MALASNFSDYILRKYLYISYQSYRLSWLWNTHYALSLYLWNDTTHELFPFRFYQFVYFCDLRDGKNKNTPERPSEKSIILIVSAETYQLKVEAQSTKQRKNGISRLNLCSKILIYKQPASLFKASIYVNLFTIQRVFWGMDR